MNRKHLSALVGWFFAISLLLTATSGPVCAVDLTYSTFFPATHAHAKLAQAWCDEVAKRTNGQVKVNLFPGGTLTPADQCYDGVVKGISDIGFAVLSYVKGRFWLTEVIDLPLGIKNGAQATHMANAYYDKFKPKELDDVKVLYLHCHGPGILHTCKKPVEKLEDLKGMKIRTTGTAAKIAAALGATPVAMPQPETYDALQKGVAEGVLGPIEILKGWKFWEVTKYTTLNYGSDYTITFFHVMNKKKWDALPKDVQKTIDQIDKEWIEKTAKTWVDIDVEGKKFAEEKGHKFIPLSKEEDARWAGLTKPILAEYVKTTKEKGLPGEEALKFCQEWLKNNPE